MWWFRSLLLGLCLTALTGCGFTPVYGTGPDRARLGDVVLPAPDTRDEFLLNAALEQRMGRATDPRYALALGVTTSATASAITTSQEITRFNVTGTVTYRLTGISDGARVTDGTVQAFTSYSVPDTTVGTQASREDAYARLMQILADQIATRLLAAVTSK